MDYQQPPPSGYPPTWPGPYPHSAVPGNDSLALGTTLGRLLAGQERTIFLHEKTLQELQALPSRLAAALPPPAASMPPSSPSLHDWMQTVREILKLLLPLALLGAIITGKLTWLEAMPLIRQAIGMAG